MATGLEAIAEKLEKERQNKLESILSTSGSQSIAKNEYGITIVDDVNVASSLLFKELNKNKYDTTELLKAVDVEIKELRPDIPTANLDLVPKPLYDEKVVENEDLRKQVADLTLTVTNLNTQISDLNNTIQTEINNRLTIEQTNDALVNQLQTLTQTIDEFALQIQTAVQKSVDESILRTSLQAQNTGFKAQIEALIKQIDSLNSIIEGLQAQLGAVQQQQAITTGTQAQALAGGADVINEVVILKINGPSNDKEFKIASKQNAKSGDTKWNSGGTLDFTNNDKTPVTITLSHANPAGFNTNWMAFPKGKSFPIAAGASETVELGIISKAGDGKDSRKKTFGWSGSTDYKSELTVTVTKGDGKSASKSYPTKYTKNHPDSY
jgi:hypothetical protein